MQPHSRRAPAGASAGGARLEAWNLECRQEPVSKRLGPPDYYPLKPGCVEDTLSEVALTHGWREGFDDVGITELKEGSLSLLGPGPGLWAPSQIKSYRHSLWQRLRHLQQVERAHRLAAQELNVPLAGDMLAKLPAPPELRLVAPEARTRWLEDLGGGRPLRKLAEAVPAGFVGQMSVLLETLHDNRVPMWRATWLLRVVYLNHIKPASGPGGAPSLLGGLPPGTGGGKQGSRSAAFTQHLADHLDALLQEARGGRKQRPAGSESSPGGPKSPSSSGPPEPGGMEAAAGGEVASRWHYTVRLAGWTHREGLVDVSALAEWALRALPGADGGAEGVGWWTPDVAALLLLMAHDISSGQALARRVVEAVGGALAGLAGEGGSAPAERSAALLRQLLARVLDGSADLFCSIDFCLSEEELRQCAEEAPTAARRAGAGAAVGAGGAGASVAAAREAHRRSMALSYSVFPPVLERDEAATTQALDGAMLAGSAEGGLKLLPASSAPGDASLADAVALLAAWACQEGGEAARLSAALPGAGGGAGGGGIGGPLGGGGNGEELPEMAAARRVFAAGLIERLQEREAAARKGLAAAPPSRSCPAVHAAIVSWLDRRAPPPPTSGSGGGGGGGPHVERFARAAAGLLLELRRRRLFCPAAYLDGLVASGRLEAAQ
eukprot:jgi/Tetstr1/443932/TSEL_031884.t1